MMAAGISIEDAKQYVFDRKDIVVACHNSPRSVTLSGTTKAIDDMLQLFQERGLFARKLKTAGNAYHSWLMSAAGERYQQLLEQNFPVGSLVMKSLPRSGPTMVSSVTATPIAGDVPLSYWTRNLLGRVEFARAVNCLLDQFPQVNRLIEIGPHTALAGPLRDIFASHPTAARKTTYLSTLSRGSDSAIDMLELAGKLFLEQYPLDLAIVNGFQKMSTESGDQPDPAKVCQVLTNLPPYQWTYEDQDQIMPVHSRLSRDVKFRKFPRHDLLGSRVPGTSPDTPTWRNMVALENVAWLEDHLVSLTPAYEKSRSTWN
jgi:acyl transferase domain-containing protein